MPPSDPAQLTHLSVAADGPTPTPAFARDADLVVVGRVSAILPARLTTDDCQWPVGSNNIQRQAGAIVTPVVIALDGAPVWRRSGVPSVVREVVLAIPGGKVGVYEVNLSEPAGVAMPGGYRVGDALLLALRRRSADEVWHIVPTEAGPAAWEPIIRYTVNPDSSMTGYGRTWTRAALVAAIVAAASEANPLPSASPMGRRPSGRVSAME